MADTERTLFLFDIDEVLVNPIGYNVAMRLAVQHFAERMGHDIAGPTDQEIAAFHAYGMTNEWLSGALCLAAMLVEAGVKYPEHVRPSLADMMDSLRESGRVFSRPDFAAVAEAIYQQHSGTVHTPEPIFAALCEGTPPELHPVLGEVLRTIRPPEAPFAAIFQQLALGPRHYADVYQLEPTLTYDACLAMDTSAISSEVRDRLRRVLETDHCGAAIYTARPSLPPNGLSAEELEAVERRNHPPEAEMAADVAGLSDLPLIAAGRMAWLAGHHGKHLDAYVKPSPVQALAAIAAAISGNERAALEAAAQLAEAGRLVGPLAQAAGHVVVFEDSSGGVRAVQRAADLLRAAGAAIRVTGVGIAQEPVKREILAGTADWIAPDINAGLTSTLDDLFQTTRD